jgi:class 3 adenylate cyclase/tetratricopeptide (TPR) repeat protein
MRCPKCARDNPDDAKFCMGCGNPFGIGCPKCGAENPSDASFCKQCGTRLRAKGAPSAAAASSERISVSAEQSESAALDGERKTVTTLFADIKGSMDLIEDLDPEEARAIVDPALKLMMEAVQRYGGYVAQSTGDGIFGLFGAPVAHEDHPQRALYAALRMQEELRAYSDQLREQGRAPLLIRVGVNAGEVVVRTITTGEGHTEYVPIGHSTSLASRLQALAAPGSITISDTVRKLVEGYFVLKGLGPARIKGVSEPVHISEVTGLGPLRTRLQRAAARGYTRFVGRDGEIGALHRAAEQAKAGHGQIVAVMAEPGVGKSRLFFEFKATSQSGWMLLEAVSFSHGKVSAYLPLLDLLHSYFGIESGDDTRKRREKVTGKVLTLDRTLEDALPYLFALLGITEGDDPLAGTNAQLRRHRTLEALKRILLRESLNQPLMVLFEDLHWIDEDTQAFLNLLADSIGTARLLLLVNYRPEYSHQWNSKTYYTYLRLDPLGRESAGEMLDALLGVRGQATDASLGALKHLIIEKAEGTPLFMEEIYQSLIEEGTLVRNGVVKLTRSLETLKIRSTVQDILASRIDRLPAAEKELLQTLAVIGSEFPIELAREVVNRPEDELTRMLNALQLTEFIYEQPTAGALEYTFKHALTRDVAYGSLLIERRKRLHQRAGAAIESLFADHLDDQVSDLAHHFIQSGNATKAVRYLILAAKQSFERSAFVESQAQLQKGLGLVGLIPDENERARLELKLQLALAEAFMFLKGTASPEAAAATHRAEELSERFGSDADQFAVLTMLGSILTFRGNFRESLEKFRTALELAERTGDPDMIATARGSVANPLWCSGRLQEALQSAQLSMGVGRIKAEWSKFTYILSADQVAAFVLLLLGYPDKAERANRAVLEKVKQSGQGASAAAPDELNAAIRSSFLYIPMQRPDRVRDLMRPAFEASEQAGLAFEIGRSRLFLGWAIARLGNPDEGIAMIRSGIAQASTTGVNPIFLIGWTLPDPLVRAARYEEALITLEEVLSDSSYSSVFVMTAELHRLKGAAILGRDPFATASAETCFRRAIEVARSQSARWFELRATVSLARLLRDTNRRDETRAMLADIYNWFTEGFDTADLKDAKALLDELRA